MIHRLLKNNTGSCPHEAQLLHAGGGSLAVERIVAASVRIDSPLGVGRDAAKDEPVEWLRGTDLRQQRDDESDEEHEAAGQHHDVLVRQSVPRQPARYLRVVRDESDDGERPADDDDDDRD